MSEIYILLLISAIIVSAGLLFNWLTNKIHQSKYEEPFKERFLKTQLVIVSLYNNNKKFNFVVDTGSTCNIIDVKAVKKTKHEKFNCDSAAVTFGGTIKQNKAARILFESTNKEQFFEDFKVMDLSGVMNWTDADLKEPIHGLLGTDFLNHYSKVIDFKEYLLR